MVGVRRLDGRVGVALAAAVAMAVVLACRVPAAANAQAVGMFQKRASSPKPVTGVVVDPTTNLIYAQGHSATTFYRYDPAKNNWTPRASVPSALSSNGAGAAYLNGKIYVVYPASKTTMYVYDIASDSWSTMLNPLGTGTAFIAASGGELYLAGGGANGNGFVSYNPATNSTTTLAAAPNFTSDCAGSGFDTTGTLVAYAGSIYGNQSSGCIGFASYDIKTNGWTVLNPPGDVLVGAAIDPTRGTFYTSGYDQSSVPSLYIGNIAKNTWVSKPFPYSRLGDGGMGYVSTPGLQGIYATYGFPSRGFTRFVTRANRAPLMLAARPHGGTADKRLCVNFTATSSGEAVRGVSVRFANHRALTMASGKARLCFTPRMRGTYRATASKTGYASAKATVNVR